MAARPLRFASVDSVGLYGNPRKSKPIARSTVTCFRPIVCEISTIAYTLFLSRPRDGSETAINAVFDGWHVGGFGPVRVTVLPIGETLAKGAN